MNIYVIILNYNSWDDVATCLNSIVAEGLPSFLHVVIVDNSSLDKIPFDLEQYIYRHRLKLIYAKSNLGYSAGNNIGINFALANNPTHLLILNPDTLISLVHIKRLASFLDKNLSCGIVGPSIFNESKVRQPQPFGIEPTIKNKYKNFLARASCGLLFRSILLANQKSEHLDRECFPVFAVSGSCMMIPNRSFTTCFPLDDRVFLYFEEAILGHRLRDAQMSSYVVNTSVCYHSLGGSIEKTKPVLFSSLIYSEFFYYLNYQKTPCLWLIPLLVIRFFQCLLFLLIFRRGLLTFSTTSLRIFKLLFF